MKPAWSWQCETGALQHASGFALNGPITKDWARGNATGAGVKVAVVDSGVDDGHPSLGRVDGAVALEYDPAEEDGYRIVEGPHEDLYGHGTACAGIIRALAPDCEIYSVRVLGSKLTGKGFIFAGGVRWAIRNGMQVANLSLSTGRRDYYAPLHGIADEAYFANTMLVSATNNVRTRSFRAEFSSVFSVAYHEGRNPFAVDYNPHGPVEFGAAGINLEVAWLEGGSIEATGNSFATPHISGLITLILSKHPGLTPFQVKTVLAAVATNAPRR
jgi:subtilisin family serine protease